jgi:DNA-binding transcriptional ArsR family regulator
MDNLSKYASEVPDEIKSVVKGLDNEVRLAIIVALMKHGKTTFSDLKHLLELNSSSLSNHLSILQDGGLIKNVLEWNENSYSYYMTTEIAKTILQRLFDAITPSPKPIVASDSIIKNIPLRPTIMLYYLNHALNNSYPIDAIKAVPTYKTVNKHRSI